MSATQGHRTLIMLVNGPTDVPNESQCVVPSRVSSLDVLPCESGPGGVRDDW